MALQLSSSAAHFPSSSARAHTRTHTVARAFTAWAVARDVWVTSRLSIGDRASGTECHLRLRQKTPTSPPPPTTRPPQPSSHVAQRRGGDTHTENTSNHRRSQRTKLGKEHVISSNLAKSAQGIGKNLCREATPSGIRGPA
ncbi:hypothetical protein C0Q70_03553 [Pomacea canaliculata]|uniref:Uncharacterized protein n=1 Tax=Pomacea canaliculata TaxID=400727 RepID=A0A2T7PT16_POMCA|nr:hypothetical protein C0Q70_03553 [Pomacea canaliculata]